LIGLFIFAAFMNIGFTHHYTIIVITNQITYPEAIPYLLF